MGKEKAPKMWVSAHAKADKPENQEAEKKQVETQCVALIQKMMPTWVQPPNDRWGYVHDIYGKWYRNYYYFCATYRYDAPEAIQPEREIKFARLEHAGLNKFHLSYFRHTAQWWQVFKSLSLAKCLEEVERNEIFWP